MAGPEMVRPFFFLGEGTKITAISLQSWTILKLPTLPLYMLSQTLYDKTIDCGKIYIILFSF
jgi:hypothetical protein